MSETTNPGSPEAKRLGCTCPVLDNAYGEGAVVDGQINKEAFYIDPDCSIHVNSELLRAEVSRGAMGAETDGSGMESGDGQPSDQPAEGETGGSEGGSAGMSSRIGQDSKGVPAPGGEA